MNEHDQKRADALEAASIDASKEAIKALLLLNGGASVALLGFIANVFNTGGLPPSKEAILEGAIRSLAHFAIGAGLSVATTFAAYLANQKYSAGIRHRSPYNNGFWIAGQILNYIGIVGAIASLVFFGLGVATIWNSVPGQ